MRGSEKINLSKSIKEATLDVLSGVAFLFCLKIFAKKVYFLGIYDNI